ncbi:ABC transporter permease [Mycolicibacterium smegmatis]|uniref:ABC transporter, membrane spanning protein, putative n=3 Tax=Mycolicibacterium smegmatis TaxID=1772 RepID=A0QVA1_MYCS2|nr:ABC transporter permease subunit [Mycolicibacterium smegmatis]ABK73747.1 ABC transporter, membrane spanning protein, putative [Mycolicibacterium smegmatis MC2 155]AFP38908.1 ABC transporter, permease protein [Mycolicibacterium smegmatis MC2 155]AIU07681.1 ABC transporter [Mycolicibacterium smegmatis MC2 155]AIU14306.1 ABC transporter [Mycolicibacterium smegmatis]AIU20929.1 ABC transporter [Mycolicibacterium smegmatis]
MTQTVPTTKPTSDRLRARVLPPVVLLVALVAAWWIGADILDSAVFPTPAESISTLGAELTDNGFRASVGSTVLNLAIAYSLVVAVGGVLGVLIGLNAFWSRTLSPLIFSLNSVPKIVLYPIFLLFLGLGALSQVSFAFFQGLLPMFLIMLEGSAGVNRLHLKLAASLQMSYPALLRKIVVPQLVPTVLTAMRVSFGLTFVGLILAEMFSGTTGLGYELLRNVTQVRMANILGEVLLITVIALIPTVALKYFELRVKARAH